MKTYFLKALTFISVFTLLQACYPGGAEYTSDLDIAISQYESVEKLKSYKTFYIVTDSMSIVGIGTDYTLNAAAQKEITTYAEAQIQNQLGLELIENPTEANQPDLFIQLTQIAIQQTGVAWQPPYWPGYPGYPGWGYPGYPGYPWYGGGYSYYSFSNGTILMDFVDVKETQEQNKQPQVNDQYVLYLGWQGALNGVLSRANDVKLIKEGIDALLNQYSAAKNSEGN